MDNNPANINKTNNYIRSRPVFNTLSHERLKSVSKQNVDVYMYIVIQVHCVQSSTATVVWFHFRLARMDVRTREVGTFFENCVI